MDNVNNNQGGREMKIMAANRYYGSDKEELNIAKETKTSYFVKFSSCPEMEKSLRLSKEILKGGGVEMRGCHNIRMVV